MPNFFINVKEKGAKKAKNNIRGLSGAMRGLASSAMAVAGPIVAIGAAYKAISGSVRVGMEFEQSMANLKAVSGATGAEFKALEKMAKDLGGSTKFTASEVAGLGTEFAKLGFSSKEIQNVSNDTLALAAAVGAELPRAAEVAGATLRGFGINARNTGRVTNMMSASFQKSALDMEKFAESMKFVAPVAKSAGFEIEDTTAMLATLANVGIHGSMAGTALKNVFITMSQEGSALSEALGGPVTSIEELAPALMKLKEEGLSLNDAIGMTNKIAGPAFLTLVEGSGDMLALKKSITGTTASADAMAIQLDTLQGRTDILKSATEALGIELFSTSEGGMKMAVEGLTALVTGAKNAVIGLKQVDLKATAQKILSDLQGLGVAILESFKAVWGLYPEIAKGAFNKILPLLKKAFIQMLELAKGVASVIFEPIIMAGKIMGAKIANFFIDAINNMKKVYNGLADLIGLTPLDLTPRVSVAGLSMANTKIGQFISDMANNTIATEEDLTNRLDEIWTNYGANKIVLHEETKDAMGGVTVGGTTDEDIEKEQEKTDAKLAQDAILKKAGVTSVEDLKKLRKGEAKNFVKNMQTMAKAYPEAAKAAKRAAQIEAIVNAYASATSAYKAMAGIAVVGPALGAVAAAAALAAGMANVKMIEKAQFGMDKIVTQPTMILAGEAGAESVNITPLSAATGDFGGGGGQSINVSIQGNVMSEQFVEEELSEKISDAIRRGVDFGIAS